VGEFCHFSPEVVADKHGIRRRVEHDFFVDLVCFFDNIKDSYFNLDMS
jgi:hypothetical protein